VSNEMIFSVVLRTRNEIRNIANFIESYQLQSYEFKELIIVDNYSTDGTQEWLKSKNIKYHLKGNERAEQGNFGMLQLAKGHWIGYFDADMYLSSNLISSLVNSFQSNDNLVAVRIREIILGKSFGSRVRRFEREFYENTCVDAARAFKRSALLSTNGFDLECFPTPGPEDWDLDRRISNYGQIDFLNKRSDESYSGQTISFAKVRGFESTDDWPCFFHNEAEFTWPWYFKKKIYYSKAMSQYIKKWGPNDSLVKKQLGFKYRFIIVFFENRKYLRIIRSPHYMLILWVQLFLVGVFFFAINIGLNLKLRPSQPIEPS